MMTYRKIGFFCAFPKEFVGIGVLLLIFVFVNRMGSALHSSFE